MLKKIENHSIDLLSLDIFDTLVLRFVEKPYQLFREVGKKAISLNLLHKSITLEEFSLLRIRAEHEARKEKFKKNGHSEVNLSQIYEFLPNFVVEKHQIDSVEVQLECEYCYLNPEILKLIEEANSLNIPVVLTSDMYLNKFQLEQILRFNDLDLELIRDVYVSCEHNGNKSSGNLFQTLLADFPYIPAEKILHIGDNLEADVKSPRSLGIQAHHYFIIPEELKNIYDRERICITAPSILSSLRSLGVRSTGNPDSVENQLGAGILGPVFTEFCEWVLDLCEEENINQVFPLMREAELFHPMLENAATKRSFEIKIEPLYVSRESTWMASLSEWNEEELDDLLEKHSIRVSEICQTLGISLPTSFDFDFQNLKASDLNQKKMQELRDFLFSNPVVKKANQEILQRYQSLLEYVNETVDLSQKSVMVDLGFRGTINSNIEKAFAKKGVDSKFTHLLVFGADSTINLKQQGIDIRSFLTSPSINQDYLKVIQRSSFLLESLILGKTGSTKGYKKHNGKQIPILHNLRLGKDEIDSKSKVFDAIKSYQDLWLRVANKKTHILRKSYINPNFKRELCGLVFCMIDLPTPNLAQFLGKCRHEFNDGTKEIRKICSKEDFKLLEEVVSKKKFLKMCRINKVNWPQGVLTVKHPHFLLKRKLEQNSSDSYLKPMNDLLETLKAKDISNIIIYGAGDAGRSMLTAATINSIYVECFIDRKETLWGEYIENTVIHSLSDAVSKFRSIPVVIGSFQFLKQIEDNINLTCEKLSLPIEVYSIKDI